MHKVKISENQIVTHGDLNAAGVQCQDGIREMLCCLLGGEGIVVWGLKTIPKAGGAADIVTLQAGVAVAPEGSAYRGNPILQGQVDVAIPINGAGALRYDLIQMAYREVPGVPASSAFLDPVTETEFNAVVNTRRIPTPSIVRTRHLAPSPSPQDGYIALSEIKVPIGSHVYVAADIADRRITRRDGLLGHYAKSRTATYNQSDSPAPDQVGGGTVWGEINVIPITIAPGTTTANGLSAVVDASIDWRDRYVFYDGILYKNYLRVRDVYLGFPGAVNDFYCHDEEGYDQVVAGAYVKTFMRLTQDIAAFGAQRVMGMLYTGPGTIGAEVYAYSGYQGPLIEYDASTRNPIGYLYASSLNGEMKFYCLEHDGLWASLRLHYSPRQHHR